MVFTFLKLSLFPTYMELKGPKSKYFTVEKYILENPA